MSESFSTVPIQGVIPSYLYSQYADDEDLQAFVETYNNLANEYLAWFTDINLPIYTNSNINDALLDWIGYGIYGIKRPVISTSSTYSSGPLNTFPYIGYYYNGFKAITSGTAQIATDDIYKRSLTWSAYTGDSKHSSIQWLRRRIARFLYGANGTDITVNDLVKVSVTGKKVGLESAYNEVPYNTGPYGFSVPFFQRLRGAVVITIPDVPISHTFDALLKNGTLVLPLQLNYSVIFV